MDEIKIKEAFAKAKSDIDSVKSDISSLSSQIQELKRTLSVLSDRQTLRQSNTAQQASVETNQDNQTDTSTDNLPLEAPKRLNSTISTRNGGVSTDRQTDRHFDTSTGNEGVNNQKFAQIFENTAETDVSKVINSLDTLKLSLQEKFKSLTKQEFLVYTTIYQLESQGEKVDYLVLSNKLHLTESSIRDYAQRILSKGLPLNKLRENNKKIYLSIPSDFKKIASYESILAVKQHKFDTY